MLSPGNALGAENMIVNIIKKSLPITWVSHKIDSKNIYVGSKRLFKQLSLVIEWKVTECLLSCLLR